ncbi:MAG: gamma-glutamyl-gamma-aminobutyrate hydrolase family protein [Ignavibacteriae bacterium]|nr:MAG: gamma-glutamyl-gamma-aminobutyrate hydrolase family protein [Ignavibacteriota bacterium]
MKPKTGISLCDKSFENYLNWLKSADVDYKILDYRENNFEDIKDCSSLILTGGVDIFPEFYNDWEDGKNRDDYRPQRDGFEFRLFDYALNNNLPMLGICRGLQLINCKLNGTLINDIMTVRKVNHDKIDGKEITHTVNVNKDTMLYEIIQEDSGEINSSHHQAIDRPGEGLKVTARSDDGIIEAIEWLEKDNRAFMLGVQWHPERMKNQSSPFSRNILERIKKETEKI